jgi:hypothetical protein
VKFEELKLPFLALDLLNLMVRLVIFPFSDHPDHNGVRRPRSNFAFFVGKRPISSQNR